MLWFDHSMLFCARRSRTRGAALDARQRRTATSDNTTLLAVTITTHFAR